MQAVTLFFEDARDEVAGTTSLIGLLPDNIEFEGSGAPLMPKLVAFTRIGLDVNDPVSEIEVTLRQPDGGVAVTNTIGIDKVGQAIAEAKRDENPFGGILARIEASPFRPTPGRWRVIVRYEGTEYLAGSICFRGSVFAGGTA